MPSTAYVALDGATPEEIAINAQAVKAWLEKNKPGFNLPTGRWEFHDLPNGFEVRIPGFPISAARTAAHSVAQALYRHRMVKDAQLNPIADAPDQPEGDEVEKPAQPPRRPRQLPMPGSPSGTPGLVRLRVLQLLYERSGSAMTTRELNSALGISRQSLNEHLRVLTDNDLVRCRKVPGDRSGPHVNAYSLTPACRDQGPSFEILNLSRLPSYAPRKPGGNYLAILKLLYANRNRSVGTNEIYTTLGKTRQATNLGIRDLTEKGLIAPPGKQQGERGISQNTYRLTAAGLARGPDFAGLESKSPKA